MERKYAVQPKLYANAIGSLSLMIATMLIGRSAQAQVFVPPPGQDIPRNGTGGASRSGNLCIQFPEAEASAHFAMTALLPETQYGATLSPNPMILVYLPASAAGEAFFSLKDEDRNLHYQVNIPLSGEAGIISIQLPSEAALELGKFYRWYFTVACDGALQPGSLVSGLLQRVEVGSQLSHQVQELSDPLEEALFYGRVGVWYDMVAALARLRETQPIEPEINNLWQEVLNSVGLEAMVSAPLIEH